MRRKVTWKRRRLSPADVWRTAWRGITSRTQRSFLAALGIAVGAAALVALTSISDSNRTAMLDELDRMGANLLVVQPGKTAGGDVVPLPEQALETIVRQRDVKKVGAFEATPANMRVYRNEYVPEGETNGISALAATPGLFDALGAQMRVGDWFDEASRKLPVAILGADAAARLGISEVGDRVYIGGQWYGVRGIMEPVELAAKVNNAVILPDTWVRTQFPARSLDPSPKVGELESIYVMTEPGTTEDVHRILASAASPGSPFVEVSSLSDLADARGLADSMLETLGLALGAIALLVGGVGIANTMVVAVMERRGEIGLRRALGARPSQITTQFLTEAIVLSFIGSLCGAGLGLAVASSVNLFLDQHASIPWSTIGLAVGVSVLVGALAGLQPALRASRLTPNTALRAA